MTLSTLWKTNISLSGGTQRGFNCNFQVRSIYAGVFLVMVKLTETPRQEEYLELKASDFISSWKSRAHLAINERNCRVCTRSGVFPLSFTQSSCIFWMQEVYSLAVTVWTPREWSRPQDHLPRPTYRSLTTKKGSGGDPIRLPNTPRGRNTSYRAA